MVVKIRSFLQTTSYKKIKRFFPILLAILAIVLLPFVLQTVDFSKDYYYILGILAFSFSGLFIYCSIRINEKGIHDFFEIYIQLCLFLFYLASSITTFVVGIYIITHEILHINLNIDSLGNDAGGIESVISLILLASTFTVSQYIFVSHLFRDDVAKTSFKIKSLICEYELCTNDKEKEKWLKNVSIQLKRGGLKDSRLETIVNDTISKKTDNYLKEKNMKRILYALSTLNGI